MLPGLRIEPLDRRRHDRSNFTSGEPRIDAYLRMRAAAAVDAGTSRAWAACFPNRPEIVGFYAVSAHAIVADEIPPELKRRLPPHHPIGALFLSHIGIASSHQGQGIGRYLMADCFRRSARVADEIGAAFLVLDALSDKAAGFYRRLGFIDLPDPPGRMLIGMAQVRAAIAAAPR